MTTHVLKHIVRKTNQKAKDTNIWGLSTQGVSLALRIYCIANYIAITAEHTPLALRCPCKRSL